MGHEPHIITSVHDVFTDLTALPEIGNAVADGVPLKIKHIPRGGDTKSVITVSGILPDGEHPAMGAAMSALDAEYGVRERRESLVGAIYTFLDNPIERDPAHSGAMTIRLDTGFFMLTMGDNHGEISHYAIPKDIFKREATHFCSPSEGDVEIRGNWFVPPGTEHQLFLPARILGDRHPDAGEETKRILKQQADKLIAAAKVLRRANLIAVDRYGTPISPETDFSLGRLFCGGIEYNYTNKGGLQLVESKCQPAGCVLK